MKVIIQAVCPPAENPVRKNLSSPEYFFATSLATANIPLRSKSCNCS
jgi:hypothetical protein